MITRLLGITAEESPQCDNGAQHVRPVWRSGRSARVHDVKAAVEAVKIIEELRKKNNNLCFG